MNEIRNRLDILIDVLPTVLHGDDIHPTPVMRHWTTQIPLRMQGVLLTAIRGCDGAPKEDNAKCLNSMIRRAVMNPADKRETTSERGFFGFSRERLKRELPEFLHSMDQYPTHYILHVMHACEIIGYKGETKVFREFFLYIYELMVKTMHLYPESEAQMIERLTEDRIALGTVERNF